MDDVGAALVMWVVLDLESLLDSAMTLFHFPVRFVDAALPVLDQLGLRNYAHLRRIDRRPPTALRIHLMILVSKLTRYRYAL
jgi:hypothetical protein